MQVYFGEADVINSGVTSMIYWESPDVEYVMNSLFRTRPNEQIECIHISSDGIKAKFIERPSVGVIRGFIPNENGGGTIEEITLEKKIAAAAGKALADKIG